MIRKSASSLRSATLFSFLTVFAFMTPLQAQNAAPIDDYRFDASRQLILSRYRQLLIEKAPPNAAQIKDWLDTLDSKGQWPDIDYADTERAAWKTSDHLVRLKGLCRALSEPDAAEKQDARLPDAISRALAHWLEKRYKNSNWWHNEIGVPMLMRDILILLDDHLQRAQKTGALEVLNQYGRPQNGGGANTIWEAELGLEYGALTGDVKLIDRYSQMIGAEIKITKAEGIQSDWSFHAHGARLQQFHYGGAFLVDGARLGWQLSGTPWALAPEKLQILANYVLNGSQWMTRGIVTVPGTIDRSVSRPGALNSGDMRAPLRQLREAVPARAAELDAVLARQEGQGAPLVGFRAFPTSDFSTFHRPGFSFFLKTVSDRSLTTEVNANSENLKGQLLSNGDHYLLRDGREYLDLQPVWNWDLLPGVTWARDAGAIERRAFSGSLSDGISGATAMDTAFGAKDAIKLSARKFWACHGDTVVALIAGLQSAAQEPVRTALDQSLLRESVTWGDENGVQTRKTTSFSTAPFSRTTRWIYHHGLAYISLGLPLTLQAGPATGAWADINKSGSKLPLTQPLFTLVLEHGIQPNGQNSGYVLLGAVDAANVAEIVAQPSWQVLQNNAKCQAVRFSDGVVMAAFWEAGTLSADGKTLIAVDKPCLLMMGQGQIRGCDPTQKGELVNVSIGKGKTLALTLPAEGKTSAPLALQLR